MRRTKEEAEETKQKIINAAVELFETNGYNATRIEDIAEKTGMTRGAVYWHFKNKDDLFVSIFELFEKRLDRLLDESKEKTNSQLERLRWLIVNMITRPDILVGFRQMKMISVSNLKLAQTSNALQKKGESVAAKYIGTLARIIEECIADGEMRNDINSEHAAWLTAFCIAGAVGINLKKPNLIPLKGSADDIVNLFLKGFVK
jgi:AcrR family transcriptional regulator